MPEGRRRMDMSLLNILVTGAVALVGGGGGATLMVKVMELRAKREESEIERMRADEKSCREEVAGLRKELAELKARLVVIEHHNGSYLARWIKGADKRVQWLNDRAFLAIFAPLGLTREEVIGSTFEDMLDPAAAREIDLLDQAALAHPEVAASNVIQLHPLLPVMVVVKVAAIGREGELVYEGYAYRTNEKMVSDGLGAARQAEAIEAAADRMLDGER